MNDYDRDGLERLHTGCVIVVLCVVAVLLYFLIDEMRQVLFDLITRLLVALQT